VRSRVGTGFKSDTAGATAVEFALVILPFLLMVFGSIEVARLMWTRNALQQLSIKGARCMALNSSACAVTGTFNTAATLSYIESAAAAAGISLADGNITLNSSATCAGVSGVSQVSIAYGFQTAVPLVTSFVGQTIDVTACYPNQS
jgi:Flp pilus assembly protein TadG